jgi:hypothetical protein
VDAGAQQIRGGFPRKRGTREIANQFVVPAGAYFFMRSISALRTMLT